MRIFVSSTWLDLQPERIAVQAALHKLPDTKFIGMEYFGSQDEAPSQASLEEVDCCQIYVGILGGRYGSGITEQEYRRARMRGLTCLVYKKSDQAILPTERDSDQTQLQAFLTELKAHHTITQFSSSAELAENLLADVYRFIFKKYLSPRLAQQSEFTYPGPEAQDLREQIRGVLDDYSRRLPCSQTVTRGKRSIALGGDATYSVLVTGDHNTVFSAGYEKLVDLYIQPWPIFERVQLDRFRGRSWLTKKVDAFIASNERGCLVIEADAGIGKTAFMAHLVRSRGCIHHFVELAPGPEGVEAGLKSIAAQLVIAWDIAPYSSSEALPAAAKRPDFLQSLLHKAAEHRNKLRPDEKIIIAIDALDESVNDVHRNVMGLPRELPAGVYLIVSQRPVKVALSLEAPIEVVPILPGDDNNRADLREFLTSIAQSEKISSALKLSRYSPGEFVDILAAKSEGVWVYLHYILAEMERTPSEVFDLKALPNGLWHYYARYWQEQRKDSAWMSAGLAILSTLAALDTDVSKEFLCHLAEVPDDRHVSELLDHLWRPFLTVRPGAKSTYRLYHASLRDFVRGHIDSSKLTTQGREFVRELARATREAHSRIANRYLQRWGSLENRLPGLLDSAKRDADKGYGLHHITAHLELAGRDDLHQLLEIESNGSVQNKKPTFALPRWLHRLFPSASVLPGNPRRLLWYEIRDRMGNVQEFLTDIRRGWNLAEESGKDQSLMPKALSLQCRYAFIIASINSLADKMPPALLVQAVKKKIRSLEYGLTYARQSPREGVRSEIITGLACWLTQSGESQRALVLLKELGVELRPDRVIELASLLPAVAIPEVLDLVDELPWPTDQLIPALVARWAKLGPAEDALAEAKRCEKSYYRALAIAEVIPFLSPQRQKAELPAVIEEARNGDLEARTELLSIVLPFISPEQRQTFLEDVRALVRSVPPPNFINRRALEQVTRIAGRLNQNERQSVVGEILQIIRKARPQITNDRVEVVAAFAQLLPLMSAEKRPGVLDEAFAVAKGAGENTAAALVKLAAQMNPGLIAEVFKLAWKEGPATPRVLDELAPYLPDELVCTALRRLETIGDSEDLALLPALLFHADDIPAGLTALQNYREGYKGFSYSGSTTAELIATYSSRMSSSSLGKIFEILTQKLNSKRRLEALSALAGSSLAPRLFDQPLKVLSTWWDESEWDESDRAKAIVILAGSPNCSEQSLNHLVQAARRIKSRAIRAETLMNLATRLPLSRRDAIVVEAESLVESFVAAKPDDPASRPRRPFKSPSGATYSVREDVKAKTRLLTKLAEFQPEHQRIATLTRALSMALDDKDSAQRIEALETLLPSLPASMLLDLTGTARTFLQTANDSLVMLFDGFRHMGIPESAIGELERAQNKTDWKKAVRGLDSYIQGELSPEVKSAGKAVYDADDWARVLIAAIPHLGALQLVDDAIAILSELKTNALLHKIDFDGSLYQFDVDDVVIKSIARLVPFVSEDHMEKVIELTPETWGAAQAHVAIVLRLAELGLYEKALRRVSKIQSDRERTVALAIIVPKLPLELQQQVRKMESLGHYWRRPRSSATSAEKDRAAQAPVAAFTRETERPLIELALLLAAELETSAFHDDKERTGALSALAPALAKMEATQLYALWGEVLPVLASRTRKELSEDLRALIPMIHAMSGITALRGIADELVRVTRSFP